MELKNIRITQGEIRSKIRVGFFHEYLDNYETLVNYPLELVEFEDGEVYCRDGHHRLVALTQLGIKAILDEEYRVTKYKYSDWMFPNLEEGWVTPHDPRVEIRVSDLSEFKKLLRDKTNPEKLKLIELNREMYCKPRNGVYTIEQIL